MQAVNPTTLGTTGLRSYLLKQPDLHAKPSVSTFLDESTDTPKLDPTTVEGKAGNRVLNSKLIREALDAIRLAIENSSVAAVPKKQKKVDKPKPAPTPTITASDEEDQSALEDSDEDDVVVVAHGEDRDPEEEYSGSEDDEDDDLSPPPQPKPSTLKKVKAQPKPLPKAGSSTFLPSLSTGFTLGDNDDDDAAAGGYYSGSDSDLESSRRPKGSKAPSDRKNRRGQRARQA